MADTIQLRQVINQKGLKYQFIACKLGITPYGLQRKIENKTEFKASEISKMAEILELENKQRDDIFL